MHGDTTQDIWTLVIDLLDPLINIWVSIWAEVWLLHVVLDELLDFVAGVLLLGVFHAAVFKLVFELWWAEQNNSSAKRPQRGEKRRRAGEGAARGCRSPHSVWMSWLWRRASELVWAKRYWSLSALAAFENSTCAVLLSSAKNPGKKTQLNM